MVWTFYVVRDLKGIEPVRARVALRAKFGGKPLRGVTTKTKAIRALNDELRQNLSAGTALITAGVAALGADRSSQGSAQSHSVSGGQRTGLVAPDGNSGSQAAWQTYARACCTSDEHACSFVSANFEAGCVAR
jgi:hypothetical protein